MTSNARILMLFALTTTNQGQIQYKYFSEKVYADKAKENCEEKQNGRLADWSVVNKSKDLCVSISMHSVIDFF